MLLLLIAAGGFAGAAGRFLVAGWVYRRCGEGFPWGTLAVNVAGSFLLGLLLPLLAVGEPLTPLGAFITVGCIGAFTTFSTFAWDAVLLIDSGRWLQAAAYAGASLVLGLGGIAAGLLLSSTFS